MTPVNFKKDLEEDQSKRSAPLDTFSKLVDLISSLIEFVKTKNKVHHFIKEQFRKISVTVDEIPGKN